MFGCLQWKKDRRPGRIVRGMEGRPTMEVFDAVRTVLAVRAFQEKKVPGETVRKVIEAGRLTASSMNLQPWQFVVVDDAEQLKTLGAAVRTGPYVAQAAFAVAVAVEKKSKYAVSDASRAIQSMILTAWADGVGSNWTGFLNLEEVSKLLEIPDEYAVLAVVPFGYPAVVKDKGRKNRKSLAEVAHRGRFTRPYP
jgi:nitroreductase